MHLMEPPPAPLISTTYDTGLMTFDNTLSGAVEGSGVVLKGKKRKYGTNS